MKRLLLISLSFFVLSCNEAKQRQEKSKIEPTDSLEVELLKLKNQAFCDCYYKALNSVHAEIVPPDGSTYIQISELVRIYCNDNNLQNIIRKWNNKKYLSYSGNDKLYLMRCLDFYNSKDLELYIDSVRNVEILNNPKWRK